MTLYEKAAYLRGLADGVDLDKNTPEGKILAALLDLVSDIADEVEAINEDIIDLQDYIEELDDDLADVEDFLDGQTFTLADGLYDSGVDVTGTGTHGQTFQRSETHGGVNAYAALDSGDRGAVAQVAGDDAQILDVLAHSLCALLGNVAVGSAVEAVTADAVLGVVLIGDSVDVRLLGHQLGGG